MPSMLFFPKFDARLCIDPPGFNHQNIRNLVCIQDSVDIDSFTTRGSRYFEVFTFVDAAVIRVGIVLRM
ncbi:MAG TPA: hypothetical protein VK168_12740 [Saprospiraceae bacterium]|nr:hypothetical protein [Saprospiraceae bacterium]